MSVWSVNRILYNVVSSSLPLPLLSPSLSPIYILFFFPYSPSSLFSLFITISPPLLILFHFFFGGGIGLPRPVRRLCINFVNYFFFFFLILESVSLKACYGLGFSPLSLHLACSFMAATPDEFSVIHSSEAPYCDLQLSIHPAMLVTSNCSITIPCNSSIMFIL